MTVAFGGLVFAVSFATLVFAGAPDAPDGALAQGASFVLLGAFAASLAVATRSSLPVIAEVQDGPSAIFAIMASAIFAADGIEEAQKVPTLEAAIALTTVCAGAGMASLGRARLGNIVRLLPSPVTGGFLAGTGWVLTAGAAKILTNGGVVVNKVLAGSLDGSHSASSPLLVVFEPLARYSRPFADAAVAFAHSPDFAFVFAPGALLGVSLAVANRLIGQFWVVPAFLSGATAAYFAGLEGAAGIGPEEALARGWLLGPFPATVAASGTGDGGGGILARFVPLAFDPAKVSLVRWDVVFDQLPQALTVFGLSTLGLLLITSAVEVTTEREGDANEELKAVGVANVLGGFAGGLVAYPSLSSTQIAHGMGNDSRLPGLVTAAAYLGAACVGPAPLAYVPKALIGGLLLFIGVSFLFEWLVEGRETLPRSEYAVVVLIVVTVASQGYLAGVVAGVLGAAAVFVSDYSRVPIVRSRLVMGGRGGIRSSRVRGRRDVGVIARRGEGVYCAKLQGFLFFATSYTLLEEIRAYGRALRTRTEEAERDAAREEEEESVSVSISDDGGGGLGRGGVGLGGGVSGPGGVSLSRRRKKRGRGRSSYPLTHVLLDFQSVVGVDGSAIAVFEKLRRFAAREGVVLVLSGLGDRPELRRLTRIALYGETTPTFAFVDRSSEQPRRTGGLGEAVLRRRERQGARVGPEGARVPGGGPGRRARARGVRLGRRGDGGGAVGRRRGGRPPGRKKVRADVRGGGRRRRGVRGIRVELHRRLGAGARRELG